MPKFLFNSATLFKKRFWQGCFPVNFASGEIFKNTFFTEHLWTTASEQRQEEKSEALFWCIPKICCYENIKKMLGKHSRKKLFKQICSIPTTPLLNKGLWRGCFPRIFNR